jgi:hypothetical protein
VGERQIAKDVQVGVGGPEAGCLLLRRDSLPPALLLRTSALAR